MYFFQLIHFFSGYELESNNDCVGCKLEPILSLSIDDFNEPCTAVIAKRRTGTPSFMYATHLISASTWLKSFKFFLNLCIETKGFLEFPSTWPPLFTFL